MWGTIIDERNFQENRSRHICYVTGLLLLQSLNQGTSNNSRLHRLSMTHSYLNLILDSSVQGKSAANGS